MKNEKYFIRSENYEWITKISKKANNINVAKIV